MLSITRVLGAGIELNWLPPTEPNGEVHYVIYYTPEGGTEQSIDTGSNLTHYNLTGLERNRVYTNIAVQAVNSVGRSYKRLSAVIAQYTPPSELCTENRAQSMGISFKWRMKRIPNNVIINTQVFYIEEVAISIKDSTRHRTYHHQLQYLFY